MSSNLNGVSVIIPFYSNIKWLEEAVESVLNQSYVDYELIIINDGSKESLESFKYLNYERVKIVNQTNQGPSGARNRGIEESEKKYVAFLDSDDIWHKDKLRIQTSFMEEKGYKWSHHSYEYFWEGSNKRKEVNIAHLKDKVVPFTYTSFKAQTSCFLVERIFLIENNIYFPHDLRFGEDIIFYRNLAKKAPLGYVPNNLGAFRIRSNNAGFNPYIQLKSRANDYLNIKSEININKCLKKILKVPFLLSKVLSSVSIENNKLLFRWYNSTLYVIPYIMFKFIHQIILLGKR